SDTAFLDLSGLDGPDGEPLDVPFTVTYTLTVLRGGSDDFSPFLALTDHPALPSGRGYGEPPPPGVGFEQSFEPLAEGRRVELVIEMPPPRYFKFVHTRGWRVQPSRA